MEERINYLTERLEDWQNFWKWLKEQGQEVDVGHAGGDYPVSEWLLSKYFEWGHSHSSTPKVRKT